MGEPIRRRVERLEQSVPDDVLQIDFSSLTRDERAKLRTILEDVEAGRLTREEGCAQVAQHRIGKRTGQ